MNSSASTRLPSWRPMDPNGKSKGDYFIPIFVRALCRNTGSDWRRRLVLMCFGYWMASRPRSMDYDCEFSDLTNINPFLPRHTHTPLTGYSTTIKTIMGVAYGFEVNSMDEPVRSDQFLTSQNSHSRAFSNQGSQCYNQRNRDHINNGTTRELALRPVPCP